MKNLKTLSKRGLALFMSLVLCLGLLPVTAMAEDAVWSVDVPVGAKVEDLAAALTNGVDPNATEWYYYSNGTLCKGTWLELSASSHKHKVSSFITLDCIHLSPLLSGVGNNTITVSPGSTGNPAYTVDVHYVNRETVTISADKDAGTVMLVYKADMSGVDYAAVEAEILANVNPSVNVTGEGTFSVGESRIKKSIDGITAGTKDVYIHWSGNDSSYWDAVPVKVSVTFIDRTPSAITEQAAGSVYTIALQDAAKSGREKVLDAVVESFTIGGEPADLELLRVEPEVLTEETASVTISYPGTTTIAGTELTVSVKCEDTRLNTAITVDAQPDENGVYTVEVPYGKDGNVDANKVAAKLYELVQVTDDQGNMIPDASVSVVPAGGSQYKVTYGGSEYYKAAEKVLTVNVTDSRADTVLTATGISIVYDEDADAVKQAILDRALTGVPADAAIADFTFEYESTLELLPGTDIGDWGSTIGDKIGIGKKEFVPFEGKKTSFLGRTLAHYPQIGAGEQKVRITFNGSDSSKPCETIELTVSIAKAPVDLSVNSQVISVKDAPARNMVTAVRKDKTVEVGTVTVYAGLNGAAKAHVYLDMSQNDPIYVVLKGLLDKDGNGFKLADLLASQELIDTLLKAAGLSGNITEMILDAIAKATDNELIKAIIGNDQISGIIGDAVSGLTGIVTDAISKADITVHFGVPTEAGVYGVAGFVSDDNYIANPNIAVGYLVITMEQTTVRVYSQDLSVGEEIPDDMIDSSGAPYIAVYAGLEAAGGVDANLYVEFSGMDNVPAEGEPMTLRGLRMVLEASLKDANVLLDKLLKALDSKLPATPGDDTPVIVGRPSTDHPGVYAVAAVAANQGTLPGVGFGTLTVRLSQDLRVNVGTATFVVSDYIDDVQAYEDELDSLVTVEPADAGARTLVLYAGIDAGSGKLNSVLYLDGLTGAPETMTVRELRQRIAGNPAMDDYVVISALLEKLPETAADNWTVHTGKPPLQAGAYTVAAGAVAKGSVPAVGVGSLTIIDKDITVITYRAAEGGTVSRDHEFVTSTSTIQGSEAKASEGYHFVNWTQGEIFKDVVSEEPFFQPRKPGNAWEKLRSLIFTAHFERHTYDAGKVTKEASCTEDGEMTYTCTFCGAVRTETIEALGHDLRTEGVPGATCLEQGTLTTYCARCGIEVASDVIAAQGHDLVFVEGEGNCGKDGEPDHWECKYCGGWFSAEDKSPMDPVFNLATGSHKWGEWTVTTPATCKAKGSESRQCSVCGEAETRDIPQLTHIWNKSEDISATCTEGSKVVYTCTLCGDEKTENGGDPAKNHTWVRSAVTVAPTCNSAGIEIYMCEACRITEERAVSALDHDPVYVDAAAATCTAAGTTAGERCSRCQAIISGIETVPATGHRWVSDEAVAPTCESAGLSAGEHCANCGTVLTAQTVLSPLGHNYTSVVTRQPTATTEGLRTYTCTRDSSHTYTEAIPTTGAATPTTPTNPVNPVNPTIPVNPVIPTNPTNPGNGGTGNPGGGSGVTIPDNNTPLAGTPDEEIDIEDDDVPLAMLPGLLNTTDHMSYVKGYEDGTVRPLNNITRAEVATIFYRLMTDSYREANHSTTHSFTDAPFTQWYNEAIATTAKAGLVKGYLDGTVRPENNITRAEFATLASNFLGGSSSGVTAFSDIQGHWAEEAINLVAEAGWIKGDGNGKFRPDDYITRAEAVTTINRILGRATETAEMTDDMIVWPDSVRTDWWYVAIQEATNNHDYSSLHPFECWTTVW